MGRRFKGILTHIFRLKSAINYYNNTTKSQDFYCYLALMMRIYPKTTTEVRNLWVASWKCRGSFDFDFYKGLPWLMTLVSQKIITLPEFRALDLFRGVLGNLQKPAKFLAFNIELHLNKPDVAWMLDILGSYFNT